MINREILLRPRSLVWIMSSLVGILTLAHFASLISIYAFNDAKFFGLVPLFNFDEEANAPSLYSFTSLLLCAVLLLFIFSAKRQLRAPYAWHWLGLALVFAFLAVDEALFLHERIMFPVRNATQASGAFYFAWVIPYGMAALAIAVAYAKFLFSLSPRARRWFIAAGAVYLSGALGMELVGGVEFEARGSDMNLTYALMTTLEEFLEMTGIVIFVYALSSYIDIELRSLRFGIETTERDGVTAGTAAGVAAATRAPNPATFTPISLRNGAGPHISL